MAQPAASRPLRLLVLLYFWLLQFILGYILVSILFHGRPGALQQLASAQAQDELAERCGRCRLVAGSLDQMLKQPRQMDAYGQLADKLDMSKIKQSVCRDITSDLERQECRSFFFSSLATVDKWKQQGPSRMSFLDFVCIKELKICCPGASFGPRCAKCATCASNQHCAGEGTRQGNGTCVCKQGHQGPQCDRCTPGYFLDQQNPERATCKRCHRSCLYCRQDGPLGCDVCQAGFTWLTSFGCSDVDECLQSKNTICGDNTFCVNTEGSYFCYECDRACNGCHGDGPDMCLACARGYKLENGNCVATKKTILPPEANYYRYAIYLGLGICTCIILHNNVYLASLIGLAVALYIGVSEYVMNTHLQDKLSHQSATPMQSIF